ANIVAELLRGSVKWYAIGVTSRPPARSAKARRAPVSIDAAVWGAVSGRDARAALDAGITAVILDIPAYPRSFARAAEALAMWNHLLRLPDIPLARVLCA